MIGTEKVVIKRGDDSPYDLGGKCDFGPSLGMIKNLFFVKQKYFTGGGEKLWL